jgi:hypothetical protein
MGLGLGGTMEQKPKLAAEYCKDLQMLRYTNEMFSWIDDLIANGNNERK